MTQDDLMLQLALIAEIHTDKKTISLAVMKIIKSVSRANRGPLYLIAGSNNPRAVILDALARYEQEKPVEELPDDRPTEIPETTGHSHIRTWDDEPEPDYDRVRRKRSSHRDRAVRSAKRESFES